MSHSLHLEDNQAYAPIQPHIRQTPVECNYVTGHQIELVYFKELPHLLLIVLGDVHCLAHLPWTLVAPRYHRCNTEEGKKRGISDKKASPPLVSYVSLNIKLHCKRNHLQTIS